jgi:hypothetical protein
MARLTKEALLAWREGFREAQRVSIPQCIDSAKAIHDALDLFGLAEELGVLPGAEDPVRRAGVEQVRRSWERLRAGWVRVAG